MLRRFYHPDLCFFCLCPSPPIETFCRKGSRGCVWGVLVCWFGFCVCFFFFFFFLFFCVVFFFLFCLVFVVFLFVFRWFGFWWCGVLFFLAAGSSPCRFFPNALDNKLVPLGIHSSPNCSYSRSPEMSLFFFPLRKPSPNSLFLPFFFFFSTVIPPFFHVQSKTNIPNFHPLLFPPIRCFFFL